MKPDLQLFSILERSLPFHKARVKFIAQFVVALIKTSTVNFVKLSLALNSNCRKKSNYRRIQRFVAGFDLDARYIGRIVYALLPQKSDLVVSIDRTEWKSRENWINILMAGVVVRGVALPLVWVRLDGQRPSATADRIDLVKRLLDILPKDSIAALTADREFVGYQWFQWLCKENIPFYIRVKKNTRVASNNKLTQMHRLFTDLSLNVARRLGNRRSVYGNKLWVTGMRLRDDYLLIASNVDDMQALEFYKQRWGIETLFCSLKTRGFDLESTRLRDAQRIARLIGLLALAFTWAHLVGQWLATQKELKIKKHGRPEQSLFRYGLDHLQMLALQATSAEFRKELRRCIRLLKPAKTLGIHCFT